MSTKVTRDEYATLRPVQKARPATKDKFYPGHLGILCDACNVQHALTRDIALDSGFDVRGCAHEPDSLILINGTHWATELWATPDNRSIALCPGAVRSIQQIQRKVTR